MILRRWWQKAIFVLVVGGVTLGVLLLVQLLLGTKPNPVAELVLYIVEIVISTLEIWWGTRVFRGRDETDDPRPRWRASAGPRFGYVVAGLSALAIIGYIVSPLDFGDVARVVTVVLLAAQSLGVGIFYLRSSLRLSRLKLEAKAAAERDAARKAARTQRKSTPSTGQRAQPRSRRR